MSSNGFRLLTVAFYGSAVLGLVGLDQGIFWLGAVFKTLTTLLLFPVLGVPNTPLRKKLFVGLAFSLIGDVALLFDGGTPFMLGLGAFFITHIAYILAFFSVAVKSQRPVIVFCLGLAASTVTVWLSFPVASTQGIAIPVAVYALALTVMLTSAHATVGGRLLAAERAAWGALLFYVADSSLALNAFVPTVHIPHPFLLTTGVYWLGQFWIAFAGRAGLSERAAT